jgi:methylenetetrahydrofolate--tRNA-(uracil-5-)-methyltransferase
MVRIIGGGLAGSEAAWQIASRGVPVFLHEMRPVRSTDVHRTDRLAELVCSNSFRGASLENAVGLLKEEMRQLDSLVMRIGDQTRVPAGGALAVDRERFAHGVTEALEAEPLITIRREEVRRIPEASTGSPVILATGPLTSPDLASELTALIGREQLYFFDAISPIVHADSIDRGKVFRASRRGRKERASGLQVGRTCGAGSEEEGDYLNCPLNPVEYERFHAALTAAELAELHDFDRTPFFEGCLPIEVMAHRGVDTLRFGPMKPVGLTDPSTGRQPYAVVQLRQDNLAADHFSLVGFQTQLRWPEQRRVLRMIPGLEQAEFVRLGMIHRNTYINAPSVLAPTWQTRVRPGLFIAGQVSGVEGYVESAASGLVAGINAAALARGEEPRAAPRTTALGALAHYVSHADPGHYQPTNIAFGLIPVVADAPRGRSARRQAVARRALADLAAWHEAEPRGASAGRARDAAAVR